MRFEFNEAKTEVLAVEHNLSVLNTNILFVTENCDIVMYGATTSTVFRLYLDRYMVKHTPAYEVGHDGRLGVQ